MRIKNINGTSQMTCKCGSWLSHWKTYGGNSNVRYCAASTCINTDLVGAHVQKANSTDQGWYIAPLCKAHNNHTGTLEVSCTLVLANKSKTCG